MNRKIYFQPMTFTPYDKDHVIAYLNEEVIEDFIPDDADPMPRPVTAYAYTGSESDGGTLLEVSEISRDSLINGIIRSTYSQSKEDAIKTHQLLVREDPDCPQASEYASEWAKFKVDREAAIALVDKWLTE